MKAGETEYAAFPEESPFYNNSCFNPMDDPIVPIPVENVTFRVSSSEEFWYKKVLELSVRFTMNGTKINLDESS